MPRRLYRVTWTFANGKRLTRIIAFSSQEAAERAANSDEFTREIFRRAGMMQRRGASMHEYTDVGPTVKSVKVEPAAKPDAKGRSFA